MNKNLKNVLLFVSPILLLTIHSSVYGYWQDGVWIVPGQAAVVAPPQNNTVVIPNGTNAVVAPNGNNTVVAAPSGSNTIVANPNGNNNVVAAPRGNNAVVAPGNNNAVVGNGVASPNARNWNGNVANPNPNVKGGDNFNHNLNGGEFNSPHNAGVNNQFNRGNQVGAHGRNGGRVGRR